MSRQCVIIAGGKATRLKGIADRIPKSLIEVCGKPFLEYQLGLLGKNGVENVVLCVGHLGDQIRERFGNDWNGMEISYSVEAEGKLLGTGGALRNAIELLNDDFFIMYGDSYLEIDYRKVYDYYSKIDFDVLMTVYRNEDRWAPSNVVFENNIVMIHDKEMHIKEMKYIEYGLSVLSKSVVNEIPGGEAYDLSLFYGNLALEGRLAGMEVGQRFYEIGSVEGLENLREYIEAKGE